LKWASVNGHWEGGEAVAATLKEVALTEKFLLLVAATAMNKKGGRSGRL
jgi:hypothetical protein